MRTLLCSARISKKARDSRRRCPVRHVAPSAFPRRELCATQSQGDQHLAEWCLNFRFTMTISIAIALVVFAAVEIEKMLLHSTYAVPIPP